MLFFYCSSTNGTTPDTFTDRKSRFLGLGFNCDLTLFRCRLVISVTLLVLERPITVTAINPFGQVTFFFTGVEAALANVSATMVIKILVTFATYFTKAGTIKQTRK